MIEPQTRLQDIANGGDATPQMRLEALLAGLEVLPKTRKEAIATGQHVLPEDRVEALLRGDDITPETLLEWFIKEGSGRLPSDYRQLEYVGGSGSQYVITDLYLASTDVIECEFRNTSTTGYGAIYGIYKTGESSALYGNQTYYGYDISNEKVDTGIAVNTSWHSSRHDFVNGTLTIDDTTVTFTPFEFVNNTKNAVLSRYYNGNYGYNWKGYIRKFKVTRGGRVVCNLIPAKSSENVVGLYDLASGTFYTSTGGALIEGGVVDN